MAGQPLTGCCKTSATICIQTRLVDPPSETRKRSVAIADLVDDLDMMRDRVGVSLEQRPPEMADVVRKREAVEGRARVGVVDRRLLAEKIGQDDKPVAAGRPRVGEPVEP